MTDYIALLQEAVDLLERLRKPAWEVELTLDPEGHLPAAYAIDVFLARAKKAFE